MITPQEMAKWSDGSWTTLPSLPITGFCFDSRKLQGGNIFVALKSEQNDGHKYLESLIAKGAAGAIVEKGRSIQALPCLEVSDTLCAFHKIAHGYRNRVNPFVIGVTGSVGKSTVKMWTHALCQDYVKSAQTIANYNNAIGLPVSLLSMADDSKIGVFEIGMNHKGELAPLAATLAPNAAIITHIGPVHIEFFDSVRDIANEKAELLRALPQDGFAVLDVTSPYFDLLKASTKARIITIGIDAKADYSAQVTDDATGSFILKTGEESTQITLNLPGRHNILNALYAVAAANCAGVPQKTIISRLHNLPQMEMRWETRIISDVKFINDAYNASPPSVKGALLSLSKTEAQKRIAVLGEMRELGKHSDKFHDEIGEQIAKLPIDFFIGYGEAGGRMVKAAINAGYAGKTAVCDNYKDVRKAVLSYAQKGDICLLKASHGVALYKVLED